MTYILHSLLSKISGNVELNGYGTWYVTCSVTPGRISAKKYISEMKMILPSTDSFKILLEIGLISKLKVAF